MKLRSSYRRGQIIYESFAPSPHELAAESDVKTLDECRQVHVGEGRGGGPSPARFSPLSLTLSAHTLAD